MKIYVTWINAGMIMVKGMKSFVNKSIWKVKGTFEESRDKTIHRYHVNGITLKTPVFYSDEKERYLHIYYSYEKAVAERAALEAKIAKIASYLKKLEGLPVVVDKSYEKYFSLEYHHEGQEDQCFVCGIEKSSAIEAELKLCGYFCIITSAEMSATEALECIRAEMHQKNYSNLTKHSLATEACAFIRKNHWKERC